jgi:hypothetical protein
MILTQNDTKNLNVFGLLYSVRLSRRNVGVTSGFVFNFMNTKFSIRKSSNKYRKNNGRLDQEMADFTHKLNR